jgi:hypothetical protein
MHFSVFILKTVLGTLSGTVEYNGIEQPRTRAINRFISMRPWITMPMIPRSDPETIRETEPVAVQSLGISAATKPGKMARV